MIPSMIYALLALLSTAHALPLNLRLQARDVIAPPVTSPNASTVWTVGETVTVTWDNSVIPSSENISETTASLLLGYSTWESENLDLDNPLASDFYIKDGEVSFVVPSVSTRTNYIVCLLGDSGDISSNFTIIGTSSSSSAVSTTAQAALASSSPSISVILTTEVITSEAFTTIPATTVTGTTEVVSTPDPTTSASSDPPAGSSSSSDPTSSDSLVTKATAATSVVVMTTSDPPSSTSTTFVSSTGASDSTSGALGWKASSAWSPLLLALTSVAITLLV